jgi:hypothetical protein
MQSQFFDWPQKSLKKGQKDESLKVQGQLRPIELWEYIFPEEKLDEVCSMMQLSEDGYWGKGKAKYALPFLRKALGAEKLKGYKRIATSKFIPRESLGVEVIGIKKDDKAPWPNGKYSREML